MRREFAQKKVVSRCVADETTDQKASKALFLQLHLNLFNSSLEMTIWLQSPHSSPVRWEDPCLRGSPRYLKLGGKGREPIGHPIEDPCLQGFIKSGDNEDSQTEKDHSKPLLADFAGVQ